MKHLEETPWFICNKEDKNYCAYVDTDSNYFNAEPILKHLYPNFEELSDIEKDSKLEKVALAYQDIITEDYDRLARETFNITTHRLEMKTECVIRSAYFRATRRYAQWITKQEGINKEVLDIKGLEFMKANFPPILGDFFNNILPCERGDIVEVLDALCDITYVSLGNGTMLHGLKSKIWPAYEEVQASGHVHLSLNIYQDVHEILASLGLNVLVAVGFIIDYRKNGKK